MNDKEAKEEQKYNLKPSDFNTKNRPTWCIGCGNYGIWSSIKKAFVELELFPHEILIVFGIGCSGNGNNFIKTYAYHALHGMALPVATGAQLSNHALKIIAMTGDGDGVGIGGNHFLHTCRRNLDITHIMHDNRIYGLTTGQTSPTSTRGFKTKSTPYGALEHPINPVMLALSCGATFVARGYSAEPEQLKNIMVKAIMHKGFSFIDVLQPCVTFNKIDTYDYYRERVYKLEDLRDYDTGNFLQAFQKSMEQGKIPLGIFYQTQRDTYHESLDQIKGKPLVFQDIISIVEMIFNKDLWDKILCLEIEKKPVRNWHWSWINIKIKMYWFLPFREGALKLVLRWHYTLTVILIFWFQENYPSLTIRKLVLVP